MKKVVSSVLVCALLVCTLFTLVSCGKSVTGTYKCTFTDSNYEVYEFEMFGKVTKSTTTGAFGYTNTKTVEGKYELNEVGENKYSITFTWEAEDGEKIETVDYSSGEEDGVKYIKLGAFKYVEVK